MDFLTKIVDLLFEREVLLHLLNPLATGLKFVHLKLLA